MLAYPGVVLRYRDAIYWLSAGHIRAEIECLTKHEKIRVEGYRLVDNYGPAPRSAEPIPFPLDDITQLHVYDKAEGLDFWLVELTPHYQKLLSSNGIVPISDSFWYPESAPDCDTFAMLGSPEEAVSQDAIPTEYGFHLVGSISPTLLHVEVDEGWNEGEWFVGNVPSQDVINTVVGMSGGPIFGFSGDRYWVIAIQSWWNKNRRVIYGCWLRRITSLLDKSLREQEDGER